MKNKLIFTLGLIIPCIFLLGCSNQDKNEPTEKNTTSYSMPGSKNIKKPFVLMNSTYEKCPYVVTNNNIIFANPSDENRISYIDSSFNKEIIDTSDIKDFIDLKTDDLCVVNDEIYFSNIANGNTLSSTDFVSKTETVISKDNVSNLVACDNLIYYINNSNSQRLCVYDTAKKQTSLISSGAVGSYIINGDFIIYINPNDSRKLFYMRTDGSDVTKLTDFGVDSFVIYDNMLLIINSSDNNNLYMLDPSTLKATRLFLMNGENIKTFNGKLFYTSCNDANYLYSLNIDINNSTCTTIPFVKEGISDYYLNEKGIFLEKSIKPNNICYVSY